MTSSLLRRHVRRSPFVVLYWAPSELRANNFAIRTECAVDETDVRILNLTGRWTRVEQLRDALGDPFTRAQVEERVETLLDRSLLVSIAEPRRAADLAMERWEGWNPSAGFFHAATRDVVYAGPPAPEDRPLVRRRAQPDPLRRRPGPEVELPEYERTDAVAETLLGRRTWRRFGEGRVGVDDLSTLLGLTWGVQAWVGRPPAALKTSPSGGAKHGTEAYVVVGDVEGIDPGTYHYDPDGHRLTLVSRASEDRDLRARMLAGQEMYADANAVVFMTCVFERMQYKYRFARAYRVALMETGHLGQTFLLLATRMGLAPFCTAALADSLVEDHLGIDGIGEAVLYAVGVGTRPPKTRWAPTQGVQPLPEWHPPTFRRRDTT